MDTTVKTTPMTLGDHVTAKQYAKELVEEFTAAADALGRRLEGRPVEVQLLQGLRARVEVLALFHIAALQELDMVAPAARQAIVAGFR